MSFLTPYLAYIKLAAILIVAGAIFGVGYHMGGLSPTAALATLKLSYAQESAVAVAKNQSDKDAYESKLKDIDNESLKTKADSDARTATLIASLHDYQASLSTRTVPQGSSITSTVPAASSGASSASSLTVLIGQLADAQQQVDRSVAGAIRACTNDSAQLTGAQAERRALNP